MVRRRLNSKVRLTITAEYLYDKVAEAELTLTFGYLPDDEAEAELKGQADLNR